MGKELAPKSGGAAAISFCLRTDLATGRQNRAGRNESGRQARSGNQPRKPVRAPGENHSQSEQTENLTDAHGVKCRLGVLHLGGRHQGGPTPVGETER
jgi:hypothetical protein